MVNNEKKQDVSFFIVNSYGKTAENISKYLSKGDGVIVEGSIEQNKWEDNDGNKREKVRIIARKVNFLPKKQEKSLEEKIEEDEKPLEPPQKTNVNPEDITWEE